MERVHRLPKAGPYPAGSIIIALGSPREGFYPDGSLSRKAILGEPDAVHVLPRTETIVTKPASAAATLAAPCASLFSDSAAKPGFGRSLPSRPKRDEDTAAAPDPEDQLIQSMRTPVGEMAPPIPLFFEQFLLGEHCEGYTPFHPIMPICSFLLCQRRTAARPHPARLPDPSRRREITAYRRHVDGGDREILSRGQSGHARANRAAGGSRSQSRASSMRN